MHKLEITEIGDALGVILPREVVERLRVKDGDELYVFATTGGVELTTNLEYARQMAIASRVIQEDRRVLDGLASKKTDSYHSP